MKKVIGTLVVIIALVSTYYVNKSNQDSFSRMQNNLNLKYIVDHLKSDFTIDGKLRTDVTDAELTVGLNSYAKGLQSGGITGDGFTFRPRDKKLFWDNSTDCKLGDDLKMYLDDGGVCDLFKDSESCKKAVDTMIHNEPTGKTTWYFDDSEERLNYLYLPFLVEGEQYIIVQGSQTDEMERHFHPLYVVGGFWGIVLILIFNV